MENNELELTPIDQYQQLTKIESNLVNQLNDIFAREFGFKPFEIRYVECIKEDSFAESTRSTLTVRLFYKPLNVCITHVEYSFKYDKIDNIKKKLLETFDRCLITDIIFGLPTNGEILDMNGDRHYNFADIKQHLFDNYAL